MASADWPSVDDLAAEALDDGDDRALEGVRRLYSTLDGVPTGLVERIQFGMTLDALHAEIAELQRSDDLVGVRSGGVAEAHTVTFTSASLTLMITIAVLSTDRVRIDGWAAPGAGVTVELRSAGGGLISATADQDGRFVFEEAPRGLAQLMVRRVDPDLHPAVITPSIEL